MATIVKEKDTGQKYILIGTGYGMYRSEAQRNLFYSTEEEGTFPMAAIADRHGNIHWLPTDELQVIEIDGVKIGDYKDISNVPPVEVVVDEDGVEYHEGVIDVPIDCCPACHGKVSLEDKICPSCGLTLVDDTYSEGA